MKRATGSQLRSIDKETMNETTVNLDDISADEREPWRKRRKRWQKPPNIEIVFIDPILAHNLEMLKEIIKKANQEADYITKRKYTHSSPNTTAC